MNAIPEPPRYPLLPDETTIKGLTDAEAEAMWCRLRWSETDGKPVCPVCGGTDHYTVRAQDRAGPRWRCKACVRQNGNCKRDISLLGGTVFHGAKVPLQTILLVISLVQHDKGAVVIRRVATDIDCQYKTAYTLIGKVKEMLFGGAQQLSAFKGYWHRNGRVAPDAPRARIGVLLPSKVCGKCGEQKAASDFQYRCGTAKDWVLTARVCKECKNGNYGIKMKESWAVKKTNAEKAIVIDRPATVLLAAPRYPNGYLWQNGAWWTPQEKHDMATLAAFGATSEQAAEALGRTAKSIAWQARDTLPFSKIPLEWKRLITLSRLTVPAAPRLFVYPYLPDIRKTAATDGAQLTLDVSALVSRAYPDFMRADVCQTVLLALLEEKTTLNDLRGSPDMLRAFVRSYRKDQDGPRTLSLDAPRFENDDQDWHGSTLPADVMNRLEW